MPACLTPEEAVEAAYILNAEYLIPIHYGTFHNPSYYCETEGVEERLRKRGEELDDTIQFLKANENLFLK